MSQGESNISEEMRLKELRRYLEYTIVPRLPLVAEGRKIIVDKKVLESVLPKEIARFLPAMPPEEREQLKGTLLKEFNRAAGNLPFDASELENEVAEPKRRLLMAPPEKLTARGYNQIQKVQMYKEWFCIRHALVKAGAHLETLPASADEGGYKEVYTRDRYVMIGNTAYLPDPQKLRDMDSRWSEAWNLKKEIARVEKALNERGIKTVAVKDAWFEGGNVVRHFSSQTIFAGTHGEWFTEDSAQKLLSAINGTQSKKWSLQPVPLTNYSAMYHLDTGMSEELPHGEVMLSPLVTDKETYQKICDIVGAENVIELSDDEAKNLATNMTDVGETLVMTGICRSLREKLTGKGYTVVMPDDYSQRSFEFGGGGVHCMTNDVPQPRRKPQAPRLS